MKYDLNNIAEKNKCKDRFAFLIKNNKLVELKEIKKTRSNQQNRALHLFFTFISDELNNLGMEFIYIGLNTPEISTMYTSDLVKNMVWRPIQIALFDIESTKLLSTEQMNQIIDVITKFLGDKGVVIEFPNIETLMNSTYSDEQLEKELN